MPGVTNQTLLIPTGSVDNLLKNKINGSNNRPYLNTQK